MSSTFALITLGMSALLTIINMIRYLVTRSESALRQEIFFFCALCFGFICWHNEKLSEKIEYYNTCIENDYTVYLNGTKVENPDKIKINGYDITFDDEKKEVVLNE